MWDPYSEFESTVLPNGLSVHASHWPDRPWEAIGFLVHSGGRLDPRGREGLAHFVEHLVSENSELHYKEIEGFFEELGGQVSFGTTSYHATRYSFFAPKDKAVLKKAFSIFGQMLLRSRLEQFVERERKVILGEFNRAFPTRLNIDKAWREQRTLYEHSWLNRISVLGDPESIKNISEEDLQTYYDTHYTPRNISVVGVGGATLSELVNLLSESPFADRKKGERTIFPAPITSFSDLPETHHTIKASDYINMPIESGSYRSVGRIPGSMNRRAVFLLTKMLGEVLYDEIRDRRGWTYATNASWSNLHELYEFSFSCGSVSIEAIDQIEEVMEESFLSLASRPDLFAQVKRRSIASGLMIDQNGRQVRDSAVVDLTHDGHITSTAELSRNLEAVTIRDIEEILQFLTRERRWTLLIKP